MAWAEPQPGGGFRGRYRLPNGDKPTVLQPDGTAWTTKKKAKDAATEEEVKGRRRAVPKRRSGRFPASTTWGDWWDYLAATKRTFDYSDTAQTESCVVRNHIRPHWGDVPLSSIVTRLYDAMTDQVGIQEWVENGLKRRPGMSVGYALRIYGTFSASMSAAVAEGVLDASPCIGVKLPYARKTARPHIVPAGVGELNLRDDYRDLLVFATETGLRPNELCGLHARRCDRERGFLTVADVYVPGKKAIRYFPKDGDQRQVPLTPVALEILDRFLSGRNLNTKCPLPHLLGDACTSPLVFMSKRGRPFTPHAARQVMKRAADNAKVQRVGGMYAARHGFATRAADGGANVFELADVMGHSDLRITKGYYQGSSQVRDHFIEALKGD